LRESEEVMSPSSVMAGDGVGGPFTIFHSPILAGPDSASTAFAATACPA
jgi:hypothetical protein